MSEETAHTHLQRKQFVHDDRPKYQRRNIGALHALFFDGSSARLNMQSQFTVNLAVEFRSKL
jgi:hypothetical protein